MDIWTTEEEADRLKARFANINRAAFARDNDLKGGQALIYQHINGVRKISREAALAYARGFGVKLDEISPRLAKEANEAVAQNQPSQTIMPVYSAEDSHEPVGMIEYWNARGSCGGGALNENSLQKGHLIKEQSFFAKYNLRPNNAFAIYADGDSMADFIVDGDIVIFDKSKKTPISGKIFAIEHPDGLRIKVLRRSIEGAWILESKNVDKRSFPDEVIPADHTELLKIHGQFVYRQGG